MRQRIKKSAQCLVAIASAIVAFFSSFFATPVAAQINSGLDSTATAAGLPAGNVNIAATVGTYIKSLLGLVGVAFLILTIYAGILWMIARGDEEMVTHAKDILRNSVIGMIIIFLAYAITTYIVSAVLKGAGLP